MSAFIVSEAHIGFLVRAATSRSIFPDHSGPLSWVWNINREAGTYDRASLGLLDQEEAQRVGQMLWDENVRSVTYRYPNEPQSDLPGACGPLVFDLKNTPVPFHIDPIAVFKACDCLEYQSCEHPEWPGSEARAFLDALRYSCVRALPGYDDAEWAVG